MFAGNTKRYRYGLLTCLSLTLLIWLQYFHPAPRIFYNGTDSMPKGFYWIAYKKAIKGDRVLVRLSPYWRRYMDRHAILPFHVPLLKKLAAVGPDQVCRIGETLFINGQARIVRKRQTLSNHNLPVWQGCRLLLATEVLLLSDQEMSFDSWYFGPVSLSNIMGVAVPLWLK